MKPAAPLPFPDGADPIDAISVWTGIDISDVMPANPSKSGYIFRCWLNENAETFDPAQGVTGDMLLTAYFEKLPAGATIEEAVVIELTNGSFNSGTVSTTEEFQNFYLTFTPSATDYYYFTFNSDDVTIVGGTTTNKYYRKFEITDSEGNKVVSETNSDTKVMLEAGQTYLIRYNLAYGSYKAWGSFIVDITSYAHDGASEAITYTFGSQVTIPAGTFVSKKETIVYSYTAETSGSYALSLGSTAWASVKVYKDAELSSQVASKNVVGNNAVVDLVTVEGTTYYMVISVNWSASEILTNTITFSVKEYAQGYTPNNPAAYTVGNVIEADFTNGNTVYYAVEIAEDGTYRLDLLTMVGTNTKVVEIYNVENPSVKVAKLEVTAANYVYLEDLSAGTYMIKAYNSSSSYQNSFTVSLTVVAEAAWWTTAASATLASNTFNASLSGTYYQVTTGTETLWYFITATNGTVQIYNGDRTLVGTTAIQLPANTTYYVVVTSEEATVDVEVTTLVEYADGKSPAGAFTYSDENKVMPTDAGNYTYYFKYTAAETGTYRFYSYNNGEIDTKGYLYSDESFSTQLKYVDDGKQAMVDAGYTGYKFDFYFEYDLEAGVTYYVKVPYSVYSSTKVGNAGLTLHIQKVE